MRHAEIEFVSVTFTADDPPDTAHIRLLLGANDRMLLYPVAGTRLIGFDQPVRFPSSYRMGFDLSPSDHLALRVTAIDFDNPPVGVVDSGDGAEVGNENPGGREILDDSDGPPGPWDLSHFESYDAKDSSPRPLHPIRVPVRPMVVQWTYPADADLDEVVTAQSTVHQSDAYDERFEIGYRITIREPVTPPFASFTDQTRARA